MRVPLVHARLCLSHRSFVRSVALVPARLCVSPYACTTRSCSFVLVLTLVCTLGCAGSRPFVCSLVRARPAVRLYPLGCAGSRLFMCLFVLVRARLGMRVRVRGQSGLMVRSARPIEPYLVLSRCDTMSQNYFVPHIYVFKINYFICV
jgi:hypothetical protein